MNILRVAKLLDFLTYVGLIAIFIYYLFGQPSREIVMTLLLLVALFKMAIGTLRTSHFAKTNKQLKDENEILARRVKELETIANQKP